MDTAPSVAPTPRRAPSFLRGYVHGANAAAAYLGIDRKAFRSWRDDPTLQGAELLQPRIIRGEAYYCLAKLDRFMDPGLNPPDATIANHLHSE